MGFFKGVGKMVKPLVNVPSWLNAKQLTKDASFIGDTVKKLFIPRKAKRTETFEEALTRLKISKQDLADRYTEFKRLFTIFVVITLLLFAYTIYLLIDQSYRGALVACVVTGIGLVQVFRYNFWMFQIKQRKLGCSFMEWLRVGVMGKKS